MSLAQQHHVPMDVDGDQNQPPRANSSGATRNSANTSGQEANAANAKAASGTPLPTAGFGPPGAAPWGVNPSPASGMSPGMTPGMAPGMPQPGQIPSNANQVWSASATPTPATPNPQGFVPAPSPLAAGFPIPVPGVTPTYTPVPTPGATPASVPVPTPGGAMPGTPTIASVPLGGSPTSAAVLAWKPAGPATKRIGRPRKPRGPPEEPDENGKMPMRISRACDQCRGKRRKCSGYLPCSICVENNRVCSYDKPFFRGRVSTPPPPPSDDPWARNRARGRKVDGKEKRLRSWESIACDVCRITKEKCSGKTPCEHCFAKRIACSYKNLPKVIPDSDDEQPDPGSADFVPPEPGPLSAELENLQPARRYANEETPPLIFLQKAWQKIAGSIVPGATWGLPFDQPFDRSSPFKLPEKHRIVELFQEYLQSWSATFPFVHRPSLKKWMEVLATNASVGGDLWQGLGYPRAAIALMALAIGSFYRDRAHRDRRKNKVDEWIWTLNFGDNCFNTSTTLTDAETGDLTLESAQARLLQDYYLLCTSRSVQAWYTFGNTLQIITKLGLHRRLGRNRGLGLDVTQKPDYAKIQSERRLFWSAYIIDKQLSVVLGRPGHFNDDTIDQELPDCVNDEDADANGPIRAHPSDCYVAALISQAQLNRLFERIYREVYTFRNIPEETRLESAARLAVEVDQWKENLPRFLFSTRYTTMLPIFRRQATLLRMGHCHAQILVYRPFVMSPYPQHDAEKRRVVDSSVRKLTETLRLAMTLVFELNRNNEARMFHTMWYPHQIAYCSAAICYMLPHLRERQKMFAGPNFRPNDKTDAQNVEIADKMTELLSTGTNVYSSGPRQGAILKELKAEVERQMNPEGSQRQTNQSESSQAGPSGQQASEQSQQGKQSARQSEAAQTDQSEDEDLVSPQHALVDALRAHREADIPPHVSANPGFPETPTFPPAQLLHMVPQPLPAPAPPREPEPAVRFRLWDKWKTTDWLDLDAAAYGPIMDYA